MDLQHLKYAVEVERTRSITKAAQNLFMGQPNLSRAIKELEREVGMNIFRRSAQGIEPTSKGVEFLNYAQSILSQVDELESLYKPQVDTALKFRIAMPRASYATVAFADFINDCADQDQLDIRFKETSPLGVIQDVAQGDADLGIVRYQDAYRDYFHRLMADKDLSHQPIWRFTMLLLLSAEHPLARFETIPYHQLAGYTEIVHGDYQMPALAMAQIKKTAHLEASPRRIFVYDRGSQFDLLQRVKGTYMWVSPMPASLLAQQNLVVRPCASPGIVYHDLMVYQRSHILSSQEKDYFQRLKSVTARMQ